MLSLATEAEAEEFASSENEHRQKHKIDPCGPLCLCLLLCLCRLTSGPFSLDIIKYCYTSAYAFAFVASENQAYSCSILFKHA